MRPGAPFFSVSDMWRSRTMAAPRMLARDWSEDIESRVTGELVGRLKLIESLESGASCAHAEAQRRPMAANRRCPLFRIYAVDRDVAGFRIHVESPHGTLRILGVSDVAAGVHQPHRLSALADLDTALGGLHDHAVVGGGDEGAGAGMFEHDAGDEQRDDAGERHGGAESGEEARLAEGRIAGADALAGLEAEADVGAHLGGEAVPWKFGDLGEIGDDF